MKTLRNKLIGKAHVLKAQIGLTADEFNEIKESVTGLSSITMMDINALKQFVNHLEALQNPDDKPATQRRLSDAQRRKVLKLALYVLHWTPLQLNNFLENQTGKIDIHWLNAREAYDIIEALSAMIERGKQDGKYQDYDPGSREKRDPV